MKKKTKAEYKEIGLGSLSNALGTIVGIVLTLGIAAYQEHKQVQEDKRNLTVMIIRDLDKSEEQMQQVIAPWENKLDRVQYIYDHEDALAEIPSDTLMSMLQLIMLDPKDLQIDFPQMAENIMTSNSSNWTTLSNVKFMENVERCYSYRRRFNQWTLADTLQQKVQKKYDEISKRLSQQREDNELRDIIALLMENEDVLNYLQGVYAQLSERKYCIFGLHGLNEENKWLMSVSTKDIQEYVKESNVRASAKRPKVTEEGLIGSWEMDMEFEKNLGTVIKKRTLELNADHTVRWITLIADEDRPSSMEYNRVYTYYGHWSLKGVDLRLAYDSCHVRPSAQYAHDKELAAYCKQKEKELNAIPTTDILSDILLNEDEFTAQKYADYGADEPETEIWHFIRKKTTTKK